MHVAIVHATYYIEFSNGYGTGAVTVMLTRCEQYPARARR